MSNGPRTRSLRIVRSVAVSAGALTGVTATVTTSACAGTGVAAPLIAGILLALPLAWFSGRSRILSPSLAKIGVALVVACVLGHGAWVALETSYVPHNIGEFRGLWRGVLVVVVGVSAVLYE